MPLTDYSKTDFPVYDIDLNAPPEERWDALCREESANMEALLQDILDCYQDGMQIWQNAIIPKALQGLIAPGSLVSGAARLSGMLIGQIARIFGQEYALEIKGMARATGIPVGYLILANMMYDLSQTAELRGIGCSSFSFNLRGAPVLARNMDWNVPETTGKYSRRIRFHKGKSHYESVSILGCVGILSAMAPGKWAMTLNQAPVGGIQTALTQWPVMHRIRAVCDEFGSYGTVVSKLQAYQTHAPFFMHVVGTKPQEHCAITGLVQTYRKRTIGKDKALVQTNHYVEGDLAEHNPIDDEAGEFYYDTYERYDYLVNRLAKPPTTLAAAQQLLDRSPICKTDTQHTMLFCPHTGTSRVGLRC